MYIHLSLLIFWWGLIFVVFVQFVRIDTEERKEMKSVCGLNSQWAVSPRFSLSVLRGEVG